MSSVHIGLQLPILLFLTLGLCMRTVRGECIGEECDIALEGDGELSVDVSPNIVVNAVPLGGRLSGKGKHKNDRVTGLGPTRIDQRLINIIRKIVRDTIRQEQSSGKFPREPETVLRPPEQNRGLGAKEPVITVHPAGNFSQSGESDPAFQSRVAGQISELGVRISDVKQECFRATDKLATSTYEKVMFELTAKLNQLERNMQDKITAVGDSSTPERLKSLEKSMRDLENLISTTKQKLQEDISQNAEKLRKELSDAMDAKTVKSEADGSLAQDVQKVSQKCQLLEAQVKEKDVELTALSQKVSKQHMFFAEQLQNVSAKLSEVPNDVLGNVNDRLTLWKNSVNEQINALDVPSAFHKLKELDHHLTETASNCTRKIATAVEGAMAKVDHKLGTHLHQSDQKLQILIDRMRGIESNVTEVTRNVATVTSATAGQSLSEVSKRLDTIEKVVEERVRNELSKTIDEKLEGVRKKVEEVAKTQNDGKLTATVEQVAKLTNQVTQLGNTQKQLPSKAEFEALSDKLRKVEGQITDTVRDVTQFATQAAVNASDVVNGRVGELATSLTKSVHDAQKEMDSVKSKLATQSQMTTALSQSATDFRTQLSNVESRLQGDITDAHKKLTNIEGKVDEGFKRATKELQESTTDFNKKIASVEELVQSKAARTELGSLKERLDSSLAEHGNRLAAFGDRIESLVRETANLEQPIKSLRDQVRSNKESTDSDVSSLKTQMENMLKDTRKAAADVVKMNSRIDECVIDMKNDISSLNRTKPSLEDFEKLKQKTEALEANPNARTLEAHAGGDQANTMTKKYMDAFSKGLLDTVAKLDKTEKALRAKINAVEHRLETSIVNATESSQEFRNLKDRIGALEANPNAQTSSAHAGSVQTDGVTKKYMDAFGKGLLDTVAKLDKTEKSLRAKINDVEHRLESSIVNTTESSQELRRLKDKIETLEANPNARTLGAHAGSDQTDGVTKKYMDAFSKGLLDTAAKLDKTEKSLRAKINDVEHRLETSIANTTEGFQEFRKLKEKVEAIEANPNARTLEAHAGGDHADPATKKYLNAFSKGLLDTVAKLDKTEKSLRAKINDVEHRLEKSIVNTTESLQETRNLCYSLTNNLQTTRRHYSYDNTHSPEVTTTTSYDNTPIPVTHPAVVTTTTSYDNTPIPVTHPPVVTTTTSYVNYAVANLPMQQPANQATYSQSAPRSKLMSNAIPHWGTAPLGETDHWQYFWGAETNILVPHMLFYRKPSSRAYFHADNDQYFYHCYKHDQWMRGNNLADLLKSKPSQQNFCNDNACTVEIMKFHDNSYGIRYGCADLRWLRTAWPNWDTGDIPRNMKASDYRGEGSSETFYCITDWCSY